MNFDPSNLCLRVRVDHQKIRAHQINFDDLKLRFRLKMVFGSLVQIMIREYGHLYLVIVLLCGEVSALSNLDVREPIVKMSPALDQDNFGFSVVMHHVELPTTGDFDSFINSTKYVGHGMTIGWKPG